MIETLARRLNDQRGSLHQADDLTLVCVLAGQPSGTSHQPSEAGQAALVADG